MALTPKQEKFCREVASGKDYVTAYKSSYDWNGGEAGARNESMILANKPEIQSRIESLLKPLQIQVAKDSISARQKQIDFIQSRIDICIQNNDEQSIIRYTDMLNKINALYKETETDTKQENSISGLSTEALQKVLKSS